MPQAGDGLQYAVDLFVAAHPVAPALNAEICQGGGEGGNQQDEGQGKDFPPRHRPERLRAEPGRQRLLERGRTIFLIQRGDVGDGLPTEDPDRLAIRGLDASQLNGNGAIVALQPSKSDGSPRDAGHRILAAGFRIDRIGSVGQALPIDREGTIEQIVELRSNDAPGYVLAVLEIGEVEPGGGCFPVSSLARIHEGFHKAERGVEIEWRFSRRATVLQRVDLEDVGLGTLCDLPFGLRKSGKAQQQGNKSEQVLPDGQCSSPLPK